MTTTLAAQPGSFDTDDDGYIDLVRIDSDADGSTDFLQYDMDADGRTDIEALDLDGDGHLESFALDNEGDGKLETFGVDLDADGAVDVVVSPEFTGLLDNGLGAVDLGVLGQASSLPVFFGSMADEPYSVLDIVDTQVGTYYPAPDEALYG